jgi:hypothetical protein
LYKGGLNRGMVTLPQFLSRCIDLLNVSVFFDFACARIHSGLTNLTGNKAGRDQ